MSDMTDLTDTVEPSASASRPDLRVAAIIYNPIKVDLDALKAAVETEQAAAGWADSLWFETSKEDAGQGVAKEALAQNVSMVVVAGGDGTVRAVAEAVFEHDVSLALVPSGTGNLLARNLSLTLDDLDHSIHSAFSGEDRQIDLGSIEVRRSGGAVEKHSYLVMAGLGLDAKMLAHTDDELKAKIGWLAYVKAIVMALRDKNDLRFRYKADAKPVRSIRAHTVIIGNCGSLQGNVLLLPDAAIDDGKLDILLMRPEGFVGWAQVLTKILWENGIVRRTALGRKFRESKVDALNYVTAERFTLKLTRPERIELDGDELGEVVSLRTWVEPKGLTVRVPADSTD